MKKLIIASLIGLLPNICHSSNDLYMYDCHTKLQIVTDKANLKDKTLELIPEGLELKDIENDSRYKFMLDFTIDRITGHKTGSTMFGMFQDQKAQVLSTGNSESAFIVTWISKAARGGVHFDVLRVDNFVKGPQKPFIALAGGTAYVGVCKSF